MTSSEKSSLKSYFSDPVDSEKSFQLKSIPHKNFQTKVDPLWAGRKRDRLFYCLNKLKITYFSGGVDRAEPISDGKGCDVATVSFRGIL